MISKQPFRIVVSSKAFLNIQTCVTVAENTYETGGILIGYKLCNTFFVVTSTSQEESEARSKVTFTLNGNEHTQKASQIISQFKFKPLVLGVWHSHICDGACFSELDRISNKSFAEFFNGALSMLAVMQDDKISLTTHFISASGIDHFGKTYVLKRL